MIYHNDPRATQDIKKFLSDNTRGKLVDPTQAKLTKGEGKYLNIRGDSTPTKKTKKR
jgi:hypothetical protein